MKNNSDLFSYYLLCENKNFDTYSKYFEYIILNYLSNMDFAIVD